MVGQFHFIDAISATKTTEDTTQLSTTVDVTLVTIPTAAKTVALSKFVRNGYFRNAPLGTFWESS